MGGKEGGREGAEEKGGVDIEPSVCVDVCSDEQKKVWIDRAKKTIVCAVTSSV